ncbi:MAG: cob(I)alamin adenosyltransferase [Candidatus Diapherotrites archaeon]|nr:cob(I)alamin adenosyltransferase [Candidatus Diapherotrites archaeon]
MHVYTKTGDLGETQIGTERKPKDCPDAEVIGEIDELVSLLGVVASKIDNPSEIERIISDLMSLNAHIMSEGKYAFRGSTETLERRIDEMWVDAGDLNRFILRFTDLIASEIHYARAVCRRVERKLVAFSKGADWMDRKALAYVNRLSDYLFALARWANKKNGGKEIPWLSDRT